MRRVKRQNERGATAVVVALLLVVLTGFTALAVDVGAVRWDQKQLQNGADAAAFAIANDCAKGTCGNAQTTATNLADANTSGTGADTVTVDLKANSVKVDVGATREHWFAPVLGTDSTDVSARARVEWGTPRSMSTLPMAISQCAFRNALLDNPSNLVFLQTKGGSVGSGADPCSPDNTPHVVPGGFHWLKPTGPNCETRPTVGQKSSSSTGNTSPNGCSNNYLNTMMRGSEVLVPMFSTASGNGANAKYDIVGFAAMRVTTYCLTNQVASTSMNTSVPGIKKCNGSQRWIEGYFVRYVSQEEAELGSGISNHGVTIVRLTD